VTRIYDLAMTHKLDADDYFIHCIQRLCAEARLNFFLIEPAWVELFFAYLQQGKVWPRALLNMHSEHHQPDDIFHRLVNLAAERQAQVIDPPARARAAFDKSRLHPRLVEAGLPIPWTLIVPRERSRDWRLSDEQRAALATPFVIKPAMGYGRKGLVLDATREADLDRSLSAWPDQHYLFQRRIVPRERDGEPLYFRAFHVFGAVYVCWWNCYTDRYRMTTEADREALGLHRIEELVRHLAVLTGMNFFSSEVAQTHEEEFVLIDYVNDQCHLLSQTAHPQMGVPDPLVANIAAKIVEAVVAMVRPAAHPTP
jgi:hypothetical protein